jgi:hypothetical protein
MSVGGGGKSWLDEVETDGRGARGRGRRRVRPAAGSGARAAASAAAAARRAPPPSPAARGPAPPGSACMPRAGAPDARAAVQLAEAHVLAAALQQRVVAVGVGAQQLQQRGGPGFHKRKRGLGVQGVPDSGFGIHDSGSRFRVWGLGTRVQGASERTSSYTSAADPGAAAGRAARRQCGRRASRPGVPPRAWPSPSPGRALRRTPRALPPAPRARRRSAGGRRRRGGRGAAGAAWPWRASRSAASEERPGAAQPGAAPTAWAAALRRPGTAPARSAPPGLSPRPAPLPPGGGAHAPRARACRRSVGSSDRMWAPRMALMRRASTPTPHCAETSAYSVWWSNHAASALAAERAGGGIEGRARAYATRTYMHTRIHTCAHMNMHKHKHARGTWHVHRHRHRHRHTPPGPKGY